MMVVDIPQNTRGVMISKRLGLPTPLAFVPACKSNIHQPSIGLMCQMHIRAKKSIIALIVHQQYF
jgi:hypothetical protein